MRNRCFLLVIGLALGITLTACNLGRVDAPATAPSTTGPALATPTAISDPLTLVSGSLGAALDEYVLKNYPLFSGAVLVARQGQVLLSKGYKYADWELEVDNTSGTKFRIASLTKPFTAAAILLLQERDLLDVQDQVCQYIEICPQDWQPITIHQLLTHTSGIPDYTSLPGALQQAVSPHSVAEIIDSFKGEPLEFTPGESYKYSNSGYILLGVVIEEVSGGPYDQFVRENLLLPFGLNDTGYDRQYVVLKGRAAGYNIAGDTFINAPYVDMSNTYAAGGLYSTVGDLYSWEQALVDGRIISEESLEAMITPHTTTDQSGSGYGYGLQVAGSGGHRRVGHEGGLPGFHSFLGYYPDDQVSIIVLSNIDASDVLAIAGGLEPIVFAEQ